MMVLKEYQKIGKERQKESTFLSFIIEILNHVCQIWQIINPCLASLIALDTHYRHDWFNWNIVESGIKHHNPNPLPGLYDVDVSYMKTVYKLKIHVYKISSLIV